MLAKADGRTLARAIRDYEKIDEALGRIMSYASLLYAADMTDAERARFYQSMQETATDISAHLLFFTLEINRIPDRALDEQLAAPELAHYRPCLRDPRPLPRPQQAAHPEHTLHHQAENRR